MIPRKGAEVAQITEKSLRDVLEVRKALEELSVQLACERITPDMLKKLEEAAEDFRRILKSKDITEIAQADVCFHDVIYQAADNQRLTQLLSNLGEQMYRYRVEYLKNPEVFGQLLREHEEIICHIRKGEKEKAVRIVCEHIDNQVAAVSDLIRTKKT